MRFGVAVNDFFCASQLSICLAERDGAFELASRIQNTNFTCPEARAGFRIVDGLIFLREHRLDAWSFKNFLARAVRFDLNHRHFAKPAISSNWLDGIICGGSSR